MKKNTLFLISLIMVTFTIQANAKSNIVRFGDLTIGAGDSVTDAVVLFGSLTVEGSVEKDAVVVFGNLDVKQGGKINHDAVVVGGNLTFVSPNQIVGEKVNIGLTGNNNGNLFGNIFKVTLLGAFIKYLGILASKLFFLITSIILAFIFAKPLMTIGETITSAPWKCGLIGLLVWLCFPATLLLLILTIVGIFMLPLIIPLVFIVVIFSFASMSALIGKQIKIKNVSPAVQITLGATVIFLLSLIPFAYYFIFLITILMGSGAILFSKFGTSKPKFLS